MLVLLFLLISASTANAAPCCGAGLATPSFITGDDSAQVSVSAAYGRVIGDAPSQGLAVFRADEDNETAQSFQLDGAVLLSDRWQLGGSVPLLRRARSTQSSQGASTGLGDLRFNAALEALPEWEYSLWKPRGYLFATATLPTGRSLTDSLEYPSQPWALDSRGKGYYSLSSGGLLVKSWSHWDATLQVEAHRSFARTVQEVTISPGWGGSLMLAVGYSPSFAPLRWGLSLAPAFEQGIHVETLGGPPSDSNPQLVWNTSMLLSWMLTRDATLSASYMDQTLLGPARNVSLSRTLSLMLQKRWER